MPTYERIEEIQITDSVHEQIHGLLESTFGDYPNRSYANQMPTFRYLVWQGKELIGHMAIEHRMMNVAEVPVKILGIADLCVTTAFQYKNIASTLLQKLEQLGESGNIDFLVLIAQDHGVYEKNDFELVNNTCRWLMINGHQTLGVGHRRLEQCLLIKSLGEKKWKEGLVDFLGHIF